MLRLTQIHWPAFHHFTHNLYIYHPKQKYDVYSTLRGPEREGGWIFISIVPTKIFLKKQTKTLKVLNKLKNDFQELLFICKSRYV